MAYSPISYVATNYRFYKNWWLKAYVAGTTNAISMSDNGSGTNLVAKYQVNSDGFFVSAGGAVVIPHLQGRYDLYLFPSATDADNNDTSSAVRVADGIIISIGDGVDTDDFVSRYGDSMLAPLSGPDSINADEYMPQLQITNTIDQRMASAPEFDPNSFIDYGLVTATVTDTLDYGSI
jgi:hypothetical protein